MQRKLLESGNIFKRSDGRWNGVVWYSDEQSSKKRKSFCGTSKQEVKDKITAYLADFDRQLTASDESKAKFEESMGKWLRVFKFPSVERGTYDRLECTAKYQIYPILGGKVVGDITSADIKALLNHWMNEGYAYTTVKKVYNILTDYFRYLTQQEYIPKNPMAAAPMIKKSNFMASQGKEDLPTFETVTIFTPEEIAQDKSRDHVELYYFPAEQPNAKYAVVLSGNALFYSGEMRGGVSTAWELHQRGYAVFALRYRIGKEAKDNAPLEDLGRAIQFITANAETFGVRTEDYALLGYSSGGQITGVFCGKELGYRNYNVPKPGALLLAYPINDFNEARPFYRLVRDSAVCATRYYDNTISGSVDADYPPTYFWYGKNDNTLKLLIYSEQGPALEKALTESGVPHQRTVYNNAAHGIGLGYGTDAEGWLDAAAAFWEAQTAE